MQQLPILFADIGELIWVILVLIFVVGPFVLRLFGGTERQPDRTLPRRRPQPPRPAGQQQPSNVDAEIEDFLRRAQKQRGGESPDEVEVVQPRQQPRPALATRAPEPVADAVVIEAEPVTEGGLGKLASTISTSEIERRVGRLGDRVEQADDLMEARLHAVFDKGLGDLSQTPMTAATADYTPAPEEEATTGEGKKAAAHSAAAGFAARLRSPQGMRDAIVLREILERPESRW
jgi:hypothetical protein